MDKTISTHISLNIADLETKLAKMADQLSTEFPEVAAMYLFGSQAEGSSHPNSDIDLALLFQPDVGAQQAAPLLLRMAEYQAKASRLLGTDRIDVVNLKAAPPQIQFAAISRGKMIFCKAPEAVAEFIESFAQRYPDLNRYYETSCRLYRDFLKDRYLTQQKGEGEMLDINRITEKIHYIHQTCMPALKLLATKPQSQFVQDVVAIGAARYYLQTAIEAMLDINNHILSRQGLGTFETHVRTFEVLADAGIISRTSLSTYIQMVGLRNRLVHVYEQIDNAIIHQILTERLSDFETYIAEIMDFIHSS
jgi:uncharacterized protein YutE (UPF0331/DUF86 family)/predicted nucleotidyltransferase